MADNQARLRDAVEQGDVEGIRLAAQAAGAHSAMFDSALRLAIKEDRGPSVATMLEFNARVDAVDSRGETVLHLACGLGHDTIASALIDAGADVDARSEAGRTPLHTNAGGDDFPAVTRVLLGAGADVNAADLEGRTPLNLACASWNAGPDRGGCQGQPQGLVEAHAAGSRLRHWV